MSADDIRREIDASRRAIQRDYAGLRAELDFAAKAKRSVRERPLPWLGGAAFVGYLLSGRRKRKAARKDKDGKKVETARSFTLLGILLSVARLVFPLVRPQLTQLALGKLSGLAAKYSR